MNKNYIFIDRWNITKTDFMPSENGDIVLISIKSFGPLEVYEWGLDKKKCHISFIIGWRMIFLKIITIVYPSQKMN